MEYFPLSFVRDTCGVKVDRRDNVRSKQRLGDLPKPQRCRESDQCLSSSHHKFTRAHVFVCVFCGL